jgi:hypothetical protein
MTIEQSGGIVEVMGTIATRALSTRNCWAGKIPSYGPPTSGTCKDSLAHQVGPPGGQLIKNGIPRRFGTRSIRS